MDCNICYSNKYSKCEHTMCIECLFKLEKLICLIDTLPDNVVNYYYDSNIEEKSNNTINTRSRMRSRHFDIVENKPTTVGDAMWCFFITFLIINFVNWLS